MESSVFKKTLLLATAFSVGALSSAHAQTASNNAPPTTYQPYYAQQSVTTTSSSGPISYGSGSSPLAPVGERIVSDPLYLPLKGQIYGTTAYTFGQQNYTNYNGIGVQKNSVTGDDNTVTQTLAYGISDEFSMHISDAFESNTNSPTNSSTGASSSSYADGLVDPTIGATWRAVDQARHNPVDLDFTLNYTPDMFTASVADAGHDGSVALGRQTASFITGIGREMKNFSVLGSGTATYVGKRNYQSSDSGDQFTQNDGFNYALDLATQTRLTDRFSFNLGVGYNFVNSLGTANTTTGSTWNSHGANYVSIPVALNYHFIPNRVVGSLTYDYVNYENSSNVYPTPRSDTSVENHDENVFGVRLAYVFN